MKMSNKTIYITSFIVSTPPACSCHITQLLATLQFVTRSDMIVYSRNGDLPPNLNPLGILHATTNNVVIEDKTEAAQD